MQASAKRLLPQQPLFFEAEDGIRDGHVTGVQTCALPISGTGLLASMAEHDLPIRGSLVWGRRSEERRVGKECRFRGSPQQEREKQLLPQQAAHHDKTQGEQSEWEQENPP